MRPAPLHPTSASLTRHYSQAAVAAVVCPHCRGGLTVGNGAFCCAQGHGFDIARQGYVALLPAGARTDTGDSAAMVAARADFLGSGHYAPIAAAVAAATADGSAADRPVLEIGAGTGYYLRTVLDGTGGPAGLALDASKYAARRAAGDPRVLSVLSDAWSALPVADGAIGTVLSVFAPRRPDEIARVLAPGGFAVAVTPRAGHLQQLRDRLTMLTVDDGKADRLVEAFDGLLHPVWSQQLEYDLALGHREVAALVAMGPSARHLGEDARAAQVQRLPAVTTVTVAVTVSVLVRT